MKDGASITRVSLSATLFTLVIIGFSSQTPARAQDDAELAGRWTLDREQSQLPREVGFNIDWGPVGGVEPGGSAGGGRGGRGGGGSSPARFSARRESQEDSKRLQQLTAEVREPSAHLTIVETPATVTITNDRGQSRTFRPDGRDDVVQLDGVSAGVVAHREAARLVVLYRVEDGRELRYSYSHAANPAQLIVDVEFVERGGGDKVRRVYRPASATETMVTPPSAPATPTSPAAQAAGSTPDANPRGVPASGGEAQTFNQQPDAQFKGLTKLGLVIEGIGQQATACGLSQSTLDSMLSKRLSDAGLTVIHNTDEDTYVYVNIMSSSLATGLCISRYDAYVYTYTTAKPSYGDTPVLVQVSLLHKGGLAGGNATTHAEQVVKGLQEYVDQFATRIRAANK